VHYIEKDFIKIASKKMVPGVFWNHFFRCYFNDGFTSFI